MRRILALSLTAAALAVGALCVAEPASAAPTPGTLYFGGVSGSPRHQSTAAGSHRGHIEKSLCSQVWVRCRQVIDA